MTTFKIGHGHLWRIETCDNTYDWIIAVDRGITCEQHTQIVSYHPENTPSDKSLEKFLDDNRNGLQEKIEMFVDAANKAGKEFGYDEIETFAIIFKYNLLKYIIDNALQLDYASQNLITKPVDEFPCMNIGEFMIHRNSAKD